MINLLLFTYLHARKGQLDAVKFLTLDKGCDPYCKNMYGNTPLHNAALYGHLTVVTFFIEELNCDPNIPGLNGMTPLHAATQEGHVDIMKYLIDSAKCDPSQVDNDNERVDCNKHECVRVCVRYGRSPEVGMVP